MPKWTENVENRYGPLIGAMRHLMRQMYLTKIGRSKKWNLLAEPLALRRDIHPVHHGLQKMHSLKERSIGTVERILLAASRDKPFLT